MRYSTFDDVVVKPRVDVGDDGLTSIDFRYFPIESLVMMEDSCGISSLRLRASAGCVD